ncbi:O-antigen ligase family protein [Myxococcota bacterium]|nr:O-antigen ligase family protein [Myxococcota bacterium]
MLGSGAKTSQFHSIDSGLLERGLRASFYGLIVASSFSIAGIEAATLALFACALIVRFRERSMWGVPAWLVAPFVAVIFAELLSAICNPETSKALWSMRGQYRILLPFAMLPAFHCIDPRRALIALGVCVVLSALYGTIQFRFGVDWFRILDESLVTPSQFDPTGTFHAKGTFSHHLTFAGVLLLNALLFLALALCERTGLRWFWVLVAVAAITGVMTSMGRSTWLGLAIGGLVFALKLPRRWSVAIAASGLVLILAVALALSTGFLKRHLDPVGSSALVKRFVNTSLESEKDRLYLWKAGWLGFVDHPLVGAGFANSGANYQKYRELVAERHGGHRYSAVPEAGVHNVFLQVAYSMGVVGLGSFVWMFAALLVWCVRGIKQATSECSLDVGILWGTAAGLLGTLVAGLFQNNYFDAEVQNMFGLTIGFALFAGLKVQAKAVRNSRSSGVHSP